MKAVTFFEKKRVLSFEVFPPKPATPIECIYQTLDALEALHPDFISVTYGAGGSGTRGSTASICENIQQVHNTTAIAHLPCIHETRASVLEKLAEFKACGIENILALRGDRHPDRLPQADFHYATELITFIREHGDFDICAACYPEAHPESASLIEDVRHLKEKVDAGASHLISQLFFNNNDFYRFMEYCSLVGIEVPIEAGIMPITNKKSIERMVSQCGASIPTRLAKLLSRYADDPESLKAAGLEYAIQQILGLLDHGVRGIHIYTMNNPDVARYLTEAIRDSVVL